MPKDILLVLVAALAYLLFAVEPPVMITGGFGLELGKRIDVSRLAHDYGHVYAVHDEVTRFYFSPSQPSDYFATYYLTVTPSSGLVTSIHGYSNTNSVQACNAMEIDLMKQLRYKYIENVTALQHLRRALTLTTIRNEDEDYISSRLSQSSGWMNSRNIEVGCLGNQLHISYSDHKLADMAESEKNKAFEKSPSGQAL